MGFHGLVSNSPKNYDIIGFQTKLNISQNIQSPFALVDF